MIVNHPDKPDMEEPQATTAKGGISEENGCPSDIDSPRRSLKPAFITLRRIAGYPSPCAKRSEVPSYAAGSAVPLAPSSRCASFADRLATPIVARRRDSIDAR